MQGMGVAAFLAAMGSIPIKEPLIDSQQVGDFYARVSVFISAGPYISSGAQLGFPLSIRLPRQPTFFLATMGTNGALIYQRDIDIAHSTPTTFYVTARDTKTGNDFVSTVCTILVG